MTNGGSLRTVGITLTLLAAAVFAATPEAAAATKTWTGLGADANWSTAGNWSPSGAPAAGDDLVFPGGAARLSNNNDIAAGTSFNTLSFTGPTGGYALSGNAIQLVAGITAAGSTADFVNLALTLTASQTFTSSIGSGALRLALEGPIGLGSNTLTLTTTGAGNIEIAGGISGTGGLTVSGYAFVDSACSYTGPTHVLSGDLFIVGGSLATASIVTVSGGGLSYCNSGSSGPVTVNAPAFLAMAICPTLNGSVTDMTMKSGSAFSMVAFDSTHYGQITASGSVDLGGSTLLVQWNYVSSTGDSFTIINKTSGGAVTGTFAGLPEGATFTANGRYYRITYVGGDGNDVVITDLGAQPIPATGGGGTVILIVLIGVIAMLLLARRSA